MRIIGVIPARGGSKGIPRKNIRPLAGKPLIAWTIEAAQKSKLLDQYLVSTEDPGIKKMARLWHAPVLDRPARLATDSAKTWDVVKDILKHIEADIIVLLQPTSPIRDPGLIDSSIRLLLKRKADNLATGFICKFKEYGTSQARRQDVKGFFYDDGNIYVVKADLIRSGRPIGKKALQYIISREQNIDVDDEFDFWLAEQVLLRRKRHSRKVFHP